MEKRWSVVSVPYGGGYSSLNIARTPGVKRAPLALKKEFDRQKIFMSDNGFSSWHDLMWCEVELGLERQNSESGWKSMDNAVLKQTGLSWKSDKNILFLGGSHSITAATYYSMIFYFGFAWEKIGLILLDAHPDCCNKANWPVHSDWLRMLIEKKYIIPENILIIGLRQIEKSEKEFLDKFDVKYYCISSLKDVENFTMHDFSVMRALEKLRALSAIYMSIDIDVASGAYAPGTGCPSPGGFTDSELVSLVKQFKTALPNLRAADIVEINPLNWWRKKILRYDATIDLGVKLIKEIIS